MESNKIFGGETCGCACKFQDQGGASTADNAHANMGTSPNIPKETSIDIERR